MNNLSVTFLLFLRFVQQENLWTEQEGWRFFEALVEKGNFFKHAT